MVRCRCKWSRESTLPAQVVMEVSTQRLTKIRFQSDLFCQMAEAMCGEDTIMFPIVRTEHVGVSVQCFHTLVDRFPLYHGAEEGQILMNKIFTKGHLYIEVIRQWGRYYRTSSSFVQSFLSGCYIELLLCPLSSTMFHLYLVLFSPF